MPKLIHLSLLACLCSCSAAFLAADDRGNLPIELLGQYIHDICREHLYCDPGVGYEDQVWNDKFDDHWMAIDKERRYATLHTVNGIVTEIFISDNLYSTAEGVRVGDSFSKVHSAYPDASFSGSYEKAWRSGVFDLVTKDEKMRFSFDGHKIKGTRYREGFAIDLNEKIVQDMKLQLIHIVDKNPELP